MKQYTVTFLPDNRSVTVDEGTTLLQAQIQAGLKPNAPCGGKGTCGKCKVFLQAGTEVLACQSSVTGDQTVTLPAAEKASILTGSLQVQTRPDRESDYCLAFDIGTTTVVCYLLSGRTGTLLASESCLNPQRQYGADVISRIQTVLEGQQEEMQRCILSAMSELAGKAARKAGILPEEITVTSVVGNTAMHHLLLGINPGKLVVPPYMPEVCQALEPDARQYLPVSGKLRVLPNIAGFVGGDTVGCLVDTRFDTLEELTLMIDIGTNGEMVLGDRNRRAACSTAAGPAFEGAKISCGMRGSAGAVDKVWLEEGEIRYHVLGQTEAVGICGSGLLDLTAVLLEKGIIDEMGAMEEPDFTLCPGVVLTRKDVREVQLAKAAIRAGIQLLAQYLGTSVDKIQRVYLAGAFGNYLNPASACRIGMIPPVLLERIKPIGNAAGGGAQLCALSRHEFEYAQSLAKGTEFVELASMPGFQDCYVDCLTFEEDEQ